jgi:hypothetical protein
LAALVERPTNTYAATQTTASPASEANVTARFFIEGGVSR